MMAWKTLDDLDVTGRRVLVRVDFNVPLAANEAGHIQVTDDTRIRGALPTIRAIMDRGGTAILMTHAGRPKGKPVPELSVRPMAERLSVLLGMPVAVSPETAGPQAEEVVADADPGDVVLLENTRFQDGETANDPAFSRALARLGDVYVNDAFGTAHRAHASTVGVAELMPERAAGYLMDRELKTLRRLVDAPEKPFVAVVGGAKVSDKIALLESLLGVASTVLVGGAMAYTFLRAKGVKTGLSLVEEDRLEMASDLLSRAEGRIHLPEDHVVAPEFRADAPHRTVSGDIPATMMGLDIGPETRAQYAAIVREARTVVWNGPMGVFEMKPFAAGTNAMAQALVGATGIGAFTVVGGGDSVAAITGAGLEDRVSHVSTGGGAMLEFLEGKQLPGVAVLETNTSPDRG